MGKAISIINDTDFRAQVSIVEQTSSDDRKESLRILGKWEKWALSMLSSSSKYEVTIRDMKHKKKSWTSEFCLSPDVSDYYISKIIHDVEKKRAGNSEMMEEFQGELTLQEFLQAAIRESKSVDLEDATKDETGESFIEVTRPKMTQTRPPITKTKPAQSMESSSAESVKDKQSFRDKHIPKANAKSDQDSDQDDKAVGDINSASKDKLKEALPTKVGEETKESPLKPLRRLPSAPIALRRSSSDSVAELHALESSQSPAEAKDCDRVVLACVFLEPDPKHFRGDPKAKSIVSRIEEVKATFLAQKGRKNKKELEQRIREMFGKEVNAKHRPLLIDKNTQLSVRRTVVPQRVCINEDVLNYVPLGALPDGCRLKIRTTERARKSLTPRYHMFLSKQYRGAQDYYCYAVTQYHLLDKQQISEVRSQQQIWAICLQDYFDCSEEFSNMNQLNDQDVFAPYCMVLVTLQPLHDTMLGFLEKYFESTKEKLTPPVAAKIWNMVKNTVKPGPGKELLMPKGYAPSIRIPKVPDQPPLLDMDLTVLLRRLDPALVVRMLNQLSIEDSLLIVSKDIGRLTYCVECVHALLCPVQWQFPTYHTFLAPVYCRNVLQSLQPFFFGAMKHHIYQYVDEEATHQYDILVVDVDNNLFFVVNKDTPIKKSFRNALWIPGARSGKSESSPFPKEMAKDIISALTPYCRRASRSTSYLPTSEHKSRRLNRLVKRMRSTELGVEVKDRTYYLDTFKDCFVGNEAVDWVVELEDVDRTTATKICQRILERGHFTHVIGEHCFLDDRMFYRWVPWQYANLYQRMIQPGNEIRLQVDPDLRSGYPYYFTGRNLVDWMLRERLARHRQEAVVIGEALRKYFLIKPVQSKTNFLDENTRYHITAHFLMRKVPVEAVDMELLTLCRTRKSRSKDLRSSRVSMKRPSAFALANRKTDMANLDAQVFNTTHAEGIEKAEYGWFNQNSNRNMKHLADVTDVVRDISRSGWLVFHKSLRLNQLFRFDPCKTWPKQLRITYFLSGKRRELTISDPIASDQRIQVGTSKHWLRDAHYNKIHLDRRKDSENGSPIDDSKDDTTLKSAQDLSTSVNQLSFVSDIGTIGRQSTYSSSKGTLMDSEFRLRSNSLGSFPRLNQIKRNRATSFQVDELGNDNTPNAVVPPEKIKGDIDVVPKYMQSVSPVSPLSPDERFEFPKGDVKEDGKDENASVVVHEEKLGDQKKGTIKAGDTEDVATVSHRIRQKVAEQFLFVLNGYEYFRNLEDPSAGRYTLENAIDLKSIPVKTRFDRQRFLTSREPTHRQFLKQFCQTQSFAEFVKKEVPLWVKEICKKSHPLPWASTIRFTLSDRDTMQDELHGIPQSGPFLHVHIRGISSFTKRGRWGIVVALLERGSHHPVEIGRTELQRYPPPRAEFPMTIKSVEHEEIASDENSVTRLIKFEPTGPKAELRLDGPITYVHVRKSLSAEITPARNQNYGVKGRVLWVDSGCKALFEVTTLLSSAQDQTKSIPETHFNLTWKKSDFWRCIMQRVPHKQYPHLILRLFHEKTPNMALAEGTVKLTKVSTKRGFLKGEWVVLRAKPRTFTKPIAPILQLDIHFIPGGIQERLHVEGHNPDQENKLAAVDPRKNAVMPLGERRVSLKGHHISNHELEYVAWALASPFCAVKALNLSENDFDVSGLEILFLALQKSTCMLTALDISRNSLRAFVQSLKFRESLVANTSLTCLKLNRGGIDDKGAQEIASALTVNQSLLWVELSQNNITRNGASALAKPLKIFESKLATLHLRGNPIGDQGVKSICAVLHSNTALKSLNLRNTGFSKDGALAIANMLMANGGLRTLDISHNKFGFKYCGDLSAITALANSFTTNDTLKSLMMSYCYLNTEEMKIVAEELEHNSTIRHLEIHQDAKESRRDHEHFQVSISDTLHSNLLRHLDDIRQNLKAAVIERLRSSSYIFIGDYFYTLGETHAQVTKCVPSRALFREDLTEVVSCWCSGNFSFKIDPRAHDKKRQKAEYVRKRLGGLQKETVRLREMNRFIKRSLAQLGKELQQEIVRITSRVVQKCCSTPELSPPTGRVADESTPSQDRRDSNISNILQDIHKPSIPKSTAHTEPNAEGFTEDLHD
eukprot:CAMPEP_0114500462 /NCGR_PEP_ID=MMETSP0109-20121206/7976_1 /TAXON_ID=29199 /ORGANISM="Chlorarachnion reptans, Strain CCCM449" /LENGTH=2110 /DNA_ID=CAMNT_0001678123 /DNA_START=144 /DNA_END=6476 /DNA_ORIENTATION=+